MSNPPQRFPTTEITPEDAVEKVSPDAEKPGAETETDVDAEAEPDEDAEVEDMSVSTVEVDVDQTSTYSALASETRLFTSLTLNALFRLATSRCLN